MSASAHSLNDENILSSIKSMLLIDSSYDAYDEDIRMHINTVLSNLIQMGIGPIEGFSVLSGDEVWSDFIQGKYDMQPVKTYVYLKVKMYFDPPQSSAHMEAINNQLRELEVRLYTASGGY